MGEETGKQPLEKKIITHTGQTWGVSRGIYEGKIIPKLKSCYLCKRNEHDGSRIVLPDGNTTEGVFKVEPYEIPTDEEGGTFLWYWLCNECVWLLTQLGGMKRVEGFCEAEGGIPQHVWPFGIVNPADILTIKPPKDEDTNTPPPRTDPSM